MRKQGKQVERKESRERRVVEEGCSNEDRKTGSNVGSTKGVKKGERNR